MPAAPQQVLVQVDLRPQLILLVPLTIQVILIVQFLVMARDCYHQVAILMIAANYYLNYFLGYFTINGTVWVL